MRNLSLSSPDCAPTTFRGEANHPVVSIQSVNVGDHVIDLGDRVEVVGVVGKGQGAVGREPAFGGRGEHPANPEGTRRVLAGQLERPGVQDVPELVYRCAWYVIYPGDKDDVAGLG